MGPTVIAPIIFVVVALIFATVMGLAFWWDIIVVLINAIVLYVVYFRTLHDFKHKRGKPYLAAFCASLLIFFIVGNFVRPLWSITFVVLLTFVLAKIYWLIQK